MRRRSRLRIANPVATATLLTVLSAPGLVAAQPASPPAATAEIEYAYPSQSVWTTRLDHRGEPDNPLLRLAEAIFMKAGVPWHGSSYPASRMLDNLRNGKSEFSMLVNAPALEDCCLVGRKPVTAAELRVYHRADQPAIKSREDLAGKSVITIHGYTYGGLQAYVADRKNNIVINVAPTHEAAFAMLERRRADYLIDYSGPSTEILAQLPIGDVRYEVIDRPDIYLVLSKKRAEARQLMDRLEAIAESLNKEEILWNRSK